MSHFLRFTSFRRNLKFIYHSALAETKEDANFSKKLLAIRLYGTGHTTESILDLADCSRTSLMEWIRKYEKKGLDSLKDQREGGNHYKLTKEEKEQIKRTLHQYTPNQLLGDDCATSSGIHWTMADLKVLIYRDYAVIYKSQTSYWTLLTECGLSYQRTEKIFKSKSALKQANFEEQLEKN